MIDWHSTGVESGLFRELGQHCICWYPGSLCHQDISSHGTHYILDTWVHVFQEEGFQQTAFLVAENDNEYKYVSWKTCKWLILLSPNFHYKKAIISLWPGDAYGNIDQGQHSLKHWLVAWWLQAITRTNGDLSSVRSCGFQLRAISQEVLKISILDNQ